MISNPCNWPCNGGSSTDYKQFTYSGGDNMYNFQPADCGLSTSREMNIVLFADNIENAKEILEAMLIFRIQCETTYFKINKQHSAIGKTGFEKAEMLLQNRDKWIFNKISKNQIYVVGWASNDTIL